MCACLVLCRSWMPYNTSIHVPDLALHVFLGVVIVAAMYSDQCNINAASKQAMCINWVINIALAGLTHRTMLDSVPDSDHKEITDC